MQHGETTRGGRSWASAQPARSAFLFVRALALLLLFPALVLGGRVSAEALFRCEITQTVHASCCCPAGAGTRGPALSRACCCERVEADVSLPAGSLHMDGHFAPAEHVAAVVLAMGFWLPWVVSSQEPPAWTPERTQARAGPSLVVLHRRFLI